MLSKILVGTGLVSAGLLLIILTTTTPSSVGAFGILSVFLLSYIVALSCLTFIVWFVAIAINKLGRSTHLIRRPYHFSLKKSYYYSTILALAPVIMVSLQSVGGIGVYELILIVAFIFIGCIYVSRRVT
jgi:hypothetical protein